MRCVLYIPIFGNETQTTQKPLYRHFKWQLITIDKFFKIIQVLSYMYTIHTHTKFMYLSLSQIYNEDKVFL